MSEVDTLVSIVVCREALLAVTRAAPGDRASAVAGLIGALIVLASTSPDPTEMLTGMLESLETARPLLGVVGARVIAAAAAATGPGSQPS